MPQLLAGHQAYFCDNVMPKFGELNTAPAQQLIRRIFLERIIQAKGLAQAAALLDGPLIPTPAAVMQAIRLLAEGCDGEPGLGELMAVDVGGATTDVYSAADGRPRRDDVIFQGLPEPYVKRTVEGDIGMRYSIYGIVEAVGPERLAELANLTRERVLQLAEGLHKHPDRLPGADKELQSLTLPWPLWQWRPP